MYEFIEGTLVSRKPIRAVIETGGFGYEICIPLSTYSQLPERGQRVRLLTHFQVREDAHKLFGFATHDERELFRNLIGVSGIGPAIAIQILSGISIDRFYDAIETGDEGFLTQIRGIGKKTAPRLIVELSGKLPEKRQLARTTADALPELDDEALQAAEARAALETLGFKPDKAERAVQRAIKQLGDEAGSTETLVREALRHS